ncbi:MAG TPA: hypothetical protein VNQ76_18170 [Planctomicrobium sp.]|nr:hypothetical protein [Planctomicrobium sp.]
MSSQHLSREEYVEQAYFFRVLRERLADSTPVQEILGGLKEEILTTTRLPMAIDFLTGELQLKGHFGQGMARLKHYFAPFQSFIISRSEEESAKLDFSIALRILERQARFLSEQPNNPAALFIFQFECLARNKLGYDSGIKAIADDPAYPPEWKGWIARIRSMIGTVEFADLVYSQSQQYLEDQRKRQNDPNLTFSAPILFDGAAGRIARANLGKDPLYLFAALQRQLGYPVVPRSRSAVQESAISPQLELRLQRIESRMLLLEQEQRGGLDLSQFYQAPKNDVDDVE